MDEKQALNFALSECYRSYTAKLQAPRPITFCETAHIPFTRLLLDSNLVSITDIPADYLFLHRSRILGRKLEEI